MTVPGQPQSAGDRLSDVRRVPAYAVMPAVDDPAYSVSRLHGFAVASTSVHAALPLFLL